MTAIEIPEIHPTNTVMDNRPAQEMINVQYAAAFMSFLAEIGAHVVVEFATTIHSTVVTYQYVVLRECAPIVLSQIMEHYETFAVSVKEGKGVVVDVTHPKAKPNRTITPRDL